MDETVPACIPLWVFLQQSTGTQDYTSLKRRLWGHLGITVSEFISSLLNLDRPAAAQIPRSGTAGD